jgi:UDP-N-acetylmuramoyl-L-alanyl-D-glutamate--2,6-diaminopimelate ligase
VIAVFGCGGERDRGKRPLMGRIAALLADDTILTSDNPRSEDPAAILAEIREGYESTGKAATTIIDRREAIAEALLRSRRGDIVLIAGKGHETYQIVGDEHLPFDDREVASQLLAKLASGELATV